MPLLTVVSMKFFLRGLPLTRRFWFASGMCVRLAIVSLWGIPALVRTKGEFFWVGIGRHVVERSFGPMEGHGAQTFNSYLLTLPFYFVTVFVSFFPWSIKLPALTKHLWREARRDRQISDLWNRDCFPPHDPGENEASALHAHRLSVALALAGPASF